MSVRVHKMVGWGLKGLRVRDGAIDDPRVIPMGDKDRDDDTAAAFLDFIADNRDDIIRHLSRDSRKKVGAARADEVAASELDGEIRLVRSFTGKDSRKLKNPSDCVKSDEEHGSRRGVLLFRPLSQPEWFRWDDAIDWIEETHFHWQRHHTRILKTGPWPYDHWMVRFRDPPRTLVKRWRKKPVDDLPGCWTVDDKGFVGIATGEWNKMVGRWDPKRPPAAETALSFRHLKEDFRPALPAGIVASVLWSGMAKDPAAFLDALRPMVHVWWS